MKKTSIDETHLEVFSHEEDIDCRVIRGRVLLDAGIKRCTIVQASPRTSRSREVGRTLHSRIVERPDGDFTITFRIPRKEAYKRETLIAESRTLAKIMNEITETKTNQDERKRPTKDNK